MEKEISVTRNEVDLFICSCHNTEHQMIVLYDEDGIDGIIYPTVYIHTHLSKRPFWERVKYGIKYIFGYQSRYGAFDEFIFNSEDHEKVQRIADYLKKP
jgi:hypothetical protein